MQPKSFARMLLLATSAGGPFCIAGSTQAQQELPALSLEEVRNCMCLEEEMGAQREEMDLRGGILAERQNELQRVGMDIEAKRAAMDPTDEQAIAELKALIDRQQALRDLMRRDIQPSYDSAVQAFNAASTTYNEQCAGRRIYRTDVEKLQGNLQCPARP
jgi:hypothetical protein